MSKVIEKSVGVRRIFKIRWAVVAFLLGCSGNVSLVGQTASQSAIDPTVFELFLNHYSAVDHDLTEERLKAATPTSADEMTVGVARSFGLEIADFRKIRPVGESLKQQLGLLDAEGVAYVARVLKNGQNPDVKVLHTFEQRRMILVQAAVAQLKSSLSGSGWTSLRHFIDTDFASHIVRRPLQ